MPPCHLLPMATARLPSTLSAPGGFRKETDRQAGAGPAPAPPGAPQGAAGDSSPSELNCLLPCQRGPGGESAAGGGEVVSATDLSPGLGGGGQGPGWHMGGGGSEHTAMPAPPMTPLIFSEAPLEAGGCRGVLPPLSIRRGWTGLSPAQLSPLDPGVLPRFLIICSMGTGSPCFTGRG